MCGVVFRLILHYIFTLAFLFIRFLVAERFNYKPDVTNLSNGNVSKWRKKSAFADRPRLSYLKEAVCGRVSECVDLSSLLYY
jgi:hypothetical protein